MNLELGNFLAGLRESIERIRTPIDPISIQGSARAFSQEVTIRPSETVEQVFAAPSSGYNRAAFVVFHGSDVTTNAFVNYFPQEGEIRLPKAGIVGYALHNLLTGTHYDPASGVWYTVEIPDRNAGLLFNLANTAVVDRTVQMYCVFWRQY